MKLVITHARPDFDALASLALAQRVHPDAVAVLHGSLPKSVARVVAQYRDRLRLLDPDAIDLERVEALIVVDTADRRRIGPFQALLGRCPVTLYDHHPTPEQPIAATAGLIEQVGCTATLLLRILRARGTELPPEIASLALLGLHEDTGSFRYPSTSGDDHEAAAFLHGCGGTLQLVRELLADRSGEAQAAFGDRVERETRLLQMMGHRVAVAAFDHGDYLADVAAWANDLLERSGAAAALLSVGMDGQTLVFARSHGAFDVAAALREALGGGGHPGAGFARSDLAPAEALERTLAALARHGSAPLRASALMSSPVKSVPADASIAEALGLLLRFGHNGLPVLDGGELVGMVSRRDLDRAARHGIESRSVSHIMRTPVITAGPEATLTELETLVRSRAIGRIPILDGDALVGIVTRSDLLAARHPRPPDPGRAALILERFPQGVLDLLERLRREVRELGGAAYLVGGTVRDGLLGSGLNDLDASVEGVSVVDVAGRLHAAAGGRLGCHGDFGTCTLTLPNGLVIDLAETRQEYYREPGALPNVVRSGLDQDLGRRDFTVNALALRLEPSPQELIDPFGGRADLEQRLLRVLHPLSFHEDPTRLLRGVRLAARLGLGFEPATEGYARQMVRAEGLATVSPSRLRHELELTLAEAQVAPPLALLERFGAVRGGFGLLPAPDLLQTLDRLRSEGRDVPGRSYLLALLVTSDDRAAADHVTRFHWPRRVLSVRSALRSARKADTLTDEVLEALGVPGRALLEALAPQHAGRVRSFESPPYRRKVRGRDMIDLGLPSGPDVGAVLREVDQARAEGRVTSFDEELELARRLVATRARDPEQE